MSNAHKIIFNRDDISQRIHEISENINNDYKGKSLDIICLVNSAMVFTSDLIRKIKIPIQLHIFEFSSIKNTKSGQVKINLDIQNSISGKNVLIIEGMIISGKTPKFICNYFQKKYKPLSLDLCVVGFKPHLLKEDLSIKYYGFKFKNENIYGYGIGPSKYKKLDYLLDLK